MKITRTSEFTGITRTLDLDITDEQWKEWKAGGKLIQNAFPNLTDDEREFLLTGVTAEEWDDFCGEEEPTTEDDDGPAF